MGRRAASATRSLEDWLGLKPDELSFEDYCYLSGLMQSEGLQRVHQQLPQADVQQRIGDILDV